MARITQLAAAIGALVAAKYGDSLGTAVQATLVAVAGLVAAVATHEHHSNGRANLAASVQVGAHATIAGEVANAVHAALAAGLPAALHSVNAQAFFDQARAQAENRDVTTVPAGGTVPGA